MLGTVEGGVYAVCDLNSAPIMRKLTIRLTIQRTQSIYRCTQWWSYLPTHSHGHTDNWSCQLDGNRHRCHGFVDMTQLQAECIHLCLYITIMYLSPSLTHHHNVSSKAERFSVLGCPNEKQNSAYSQTEKKRSRQSDRQTDRQTSQWQQFLIYRTTSSSTTLSNLEGYFHWHKTHLNLIFWKI